MKTILALSLSLFTLIGCAPYEEDDRVTEDGGTTLPPPTLPTCDNLAGFYTILIADGGPHRIDTINVERMDFGLDGIYCIGTAFTSPDEEDYCYFSFNSVRGTEDWDLGVTCFEDGDIAAGDFSCHESLVTNSVVEARMGIHCDGQYTDGNLGTRDADVQLW